MEGHNRIIFVNSSWNTRAKWGTALEFAKKSARRHLDKDDQEKDFRRTLLEKLPYTDDGGIRYAGAFYYTYDDEFEKIVQILRIPIDELI